MEQMLQKENEEKQKLKLQIHNEKKLTEEVDIYKTHFFNKAVCIRIILN